MDNNNDKTIIATPEFKHVHAMLIMDAVLEDPDLASFLDREVDDRIEAEDFIGRSEDEWMLARFACMAELVRELLEAIDYP